jgi:hypothetical protein
VASSSSGRKSSGRSLTLFRRATVSFPQSASNPQEPWCYPEKALGEFRRWFRETYVGSGKFQSYIEGKVRDKQLPVSFAQLAVAAYVRD